VTADGRSTQQPVSWSGHRVSSRRCGHDVCPVTFTGAASFFERRRITRRPVPLYEPYSHVEGRRHREVHRSGTPAKTRQGPPQRASQRHEPPLLVITHSHAPSHRRDRLCGRVPACAGLDARSAVGVERRCARGGRRGCAGGVIVAGMGAGCAGDVAHPAPKTTRMSHVAGTAARGDEARARRVPHGGRGSGEGRRPCACSPRRGDRSVGWW